MNELALNWLVAQCEGRKVTCYGRALWYDDQTSATWEWAPATNWAQGGPIIQREKICTRTDAFGSWTAWLSDGVDYHGPTPLHAAMHCYAANRGADIQIPLEFSI